MRFDWHRQIRFPIWLLVFSIFLAVCICANGQSTASATGLSQPKLAVVPGALKNSDVPRSLKNPSELDSDSIISPDDILDVYVMDVAELSRQYRVSPSGTVGLPLLASAIPAAGMTPSQFSDALGKQLHDNGLVMAPHIVVTIVSSRLKSVAITGSVKMPQIYPVFGRTTLLDVLSQAQGLTDDASNVAMISRGKLGEQATGQTIQTVNLKNLLQTASAAANVEVYPGDRVTVPRAGIVYVVGAVNKPGGFVIKETDDGMTVLQALAMAEDAKSTAVRNNSMIIRADSSAPDGHKQIPVNLNLILAGKASDPMLHADDILFVPDSTAKKAFRRGIEAALQTATMLAIYARP
jgi:polysaccharide biosynthesis/export protein